jgi:uncharacterized protein YndB with AHSA1/START domain
MKPDAMNDLFTFDIRKEARTMAVKRFFNARLDSVWSAWTDADILCKWWAPEPYDCVITALDLRPGGRWSYYMQGPTGDRHYCFFNYTTVDPKTAFSGRDGFCDEHGTVSTAMPSTEWEVRFSPTENGTLVQVNIVAPTTDALERVLNMGFKEGFTQGLEQLDRLLARQQ